VSTLVERRDHLVVGDYDGSRDIQEITEDLLRLRPLVFSPDLTRHEAIERSAMSVICRSKSTFIPTMEESASR